MRHLAAVDYGVTGALMSTIDTHLNLGASYLMNDVYRRFLVRDPSERHYVWMSRLAMAALAGLAVRLRRQAAAGAEPAGVSGSAATSLGPSPAETTPPGGASP